MKPARTALSWHLLLPLLLRLLRHLSVLLLFHGQVCVAAPPILTLPDTAMSDQEPISLTKTTAVLEDPNRTLTLADVQKVDTIARFTYAHAAAEAFNFSFSRSAYWFRLTLHNPSEHSRKYMLQIREAMLSKVEFHQPLANNTYQSVVTGTSKPFSARPYPNRYFVFPITLAGKTTAHYYMRIENQSTILIPLYLWGEQAFHQYERDDYLIQAFYFGMVSVMIAFNLLLLIFFRNRVYLFYINFIASMAIMLAIKNGLIVEFLWPDLLPWHYNSFSFSIAFTLINFIIFMRKMIDTKKLVPKLDLLLQIAIGICIFLLLGPFISFLSFNKSAAIIYLTISLLIFYISLYCTLKGQRNVYFFLLAFTALLTGSVLGALRGLGMVPTNFFSINGMQLGSAVEMILLAFALADRLNTLIKKKEQAQKEALEAQRHLLENLQSNERELELRVQQRSNELAKNNRALRLVNTELKAAYKDTENERWQAEQAQQAAVKALNELRMTQTQLIQSEKMAALGQLISNVAHQINGPIDTIQSEGIHIVSVLRQTLTNIAALFRIMTVENTKLLFKLAQDTAIHPGTVEQNQVQPLIVANSDNPNNLQTDADTARVLVQAHIQSAPYDYLPLLNHPKIEAIMETINNIVTIRLCTNAINQATEQVTKTILALKSFSHFDHTERWIEANVQDGLETVLTIFQSTIQQASILQRQYQTVPLLVCLPDQLNQAWSHLIHNAIQSMNQKGLLTIGLYTENDEIVVSISDTGCGLSPVMREKIMRLTGNNESSGLSIVKKIITKHQGRLEIHSEIGQGSQFLVYLPQRKEVTITSAH